ncbi:MAG TPA: SgcJ/EcaC family oxidoreductase [Sphingomonas sp.]|nr:SgcJ/EcaC family oxidoreductase [Sphingomonas sp.]
MRYLMLPAAMTLAAAAPAQAPAEAGIRQVMEASAAGWNAGDLARFMAVYADDAVFVTPKGLLRGKAAIAAKYRPSFRGSGNARGTLSFAFLEVRAIDQRHAIVFARWTLNGAKKTETGMTTLVFERRGAAWQIIADHSS